MVGHMELRQLLDRSETEACSHHGTRRRRVAVGVVTEGHGVLACLIKVAVPVKQREHDHRAVERRRIVVPFWRTGVRVPSLLFGTVPLLVEELPGGFPVFGMLVKEL